MAGPTQYEKATQNEEKQAPHRTITLALSGGGFRATLFHLGVIRYLHSTNQLKRVVHIASVSGGSILAAHIAVNWSRYTGSAEDFEKISREIMQFTAQDVRGRIVRRLPWLALWLMLKRFLPLKLPLPKSTTDLLLIQLRKLYRINSLADLATIEPDAPRFSFMATNLTYPGITSFENERIVTHPLSGDNPMEFDGASIPIDLAVACSAAYPAFFSPLEVSFEDLGIDDSFGQQFFTDGGVIDNQGLAVILGEEVPENLFLISDAASAGVGSQPNVRFGLFTSSLRSMEFMMAKIRRNHYLNLKSSARRPIVIDIDTEEEDLDRDRRGAVCSQLAHMRTDLDEFDGVERQELLHHGFFSAKKALQWPLVENGASPTKPSSLLPSKAVKHLRQRFHFKLRLFFWRDWLTWVNIVGLILVAGFISSKFLQIRHFASQVITVATSQELLHRGIDSIPTTSPLPIEPVDNVGERPANPGFTVIAEDRVWDLRKLHPSSEDGRPVVVGSALMTKYTELRRDASTSEYAYWFETSGSLRVWLTSRDSRLSMRIQGDYLPRITNGAAKVSAYKGIVDCSKIPLGEHFLVVTQAEYVDAFMTRTNWWVGMVILDDMDRAAMRIVFPSQMPFHNPSFRRYPNSSSLESDTFDGTVLNVGVDQPELLWTVHKPKTKNTYRVNWDW